MGAYTPVPSISSNKMNELSKTFVEPVVKYLAEEGSIIKVCFMQD